MTIRPGWIVWCQLCHTYRAGTDPPDQLRRNLARLGWASDGDRDWCPTCKRART